MDKCSEKMEALNDLMLHLRARTLLIDSVDDWKEAVKLSGKLLVDNGCVEEKYVEKMIETCLKMGPYIVVAPGIAIPHARPEDGAKRVGFSLVGIKNGVNFGSHNDPVYVLIAFSSPDKSSHIRLLQQLASLLIDKGVKLVDTVRNALSTEDLLDRLIQLMNV